MARFVPCEACAPPAIVAPGVLPHIPVAGADAAGPPIALPGVFASQLGVVLVEGNAPGAPVCAEPNSPVAGVLAGVAPNRPGVAAGVDPNKPVDVEPNPPLVFAGVEALPKPNMASSKHERARKCVGRVCRKWRQCLAIRLSNVCPVQRLVYVRRVEPFKDTDWLSPEFGVVPDIRLAERRPGVWIEPFALCSGHCTRDLPVENLSDGPCGP